MSQYLSSCTSSVNKTRTVLHKMERFSEALHHFEAAEQIYVPWESWSQACRWVLKWIFQS